MQSRTIHHVLRENSDEWLCVPGVVGTAIGQRDGRPVILVLVAREDELIREAIPSEVDGFRVVIRETGRLRALDSE